MIIAAVVTVVISCLILQYLKCLWISTQLPAGPIPLPIIGNLWTLNFQLHHKTLIKLSKTYGNIYTVWAGSVPIVVLNGYEAVKDALIINSEAFSRRPMTPFFKDYTNGHGIILSSGTTWKQQRRFGLSALRTLGLGKQGLHLSIQKEVEFLLESFHSYKGNPVDPFIPINNTVTNVISALVFGKRFSCEERMFKELSQVSSNIANFMGTRSGQLYDALPWIMPYIPGHHKKVFKNVECIRSYVKQQIRLHLEESSEKPCDIIDCYLPWISDHKDDPGSTFNEDNLTQIVIDFFLAGSETLTTTLRWALIFLVLHPEVQETMQKELDTIIGPSETINYEHRKITPFTCAVIHEIQRYGNVVPTGLARQCIKDSKVQGFHISKGTIVLANLGSVLYDPNYWKVPQEFDPTNFLDEHGEFQNNEAFLPFSAGHRVCLGEQLARLELYLILTNLLRTFTFHMPEGVKGFNITGIFGTAFQPHPYQICAVPRKK